MKKLLLSGLAVVSFMTTSFAQTLLTDFDGGAGSITTDNTAWYNFDAVTNTVPLPIITNDAVTGSTGKYLRLSGTTAGGYYIGGVGFNNAASFGLGASINNLYFKLSTNGNAITQIKVELYSASTLYVKQITFKANAAAAAGWVEVDVPFSDLLDNSANALSDATTLEKIQFILLNDDASTTPPGSGAAIALIDDIKFSTGALASTSKASNIASSKLYPNPVSDNAKVELNLKSSSNVKVTLSDVMGKEVMTIADGSFTELAKDFSVANLNKGIYTVNYYINGEAAKAEMLMVK